MLQLLKIVAFAVCTLVTTIIMTTLPAAAQNSTGGNCSPIIIFSEIKGDYHLTCPEGHPDLVAITERLNQLVAASRLTQDQIRELAGLLNEFASGQTGKSRLAGVISTWTAASLQRYTNLTNNKYIGFFDSTDPAFHEDKNQSIIYQFEKTDKGDDEEESCSISITTSISGIKIIGTVVEAQQSIWK